mmetsp:Transcript_17441/g.66429  ORF Transcript_17441/g.66429 Transcript_17441/m.66429 type:complete len:219 (+) Transcript_17441:1182-1838(+)
MDILQAAQVRAAPDLPHAEESKLLGLLRVALDVPEEVLHRRVALLGRGDGADCGNAARNVHQRFPGKLPLSAFLQINQQVIKRCTGRIQKHELPKQLQQRLESAALKHRGSCKGHGSGQHVTGHHLSGLRTDLEDVDRQMQRELRSAEIVVCNMRSELLKDCLVQRRVQRRRPLRSVVAQGRQGLQRILLQRAILLSEEAAKLSHRRGLDVAQVDVQR